MMVWLVMNGLRIDVKGPRMGRKGSKSPQFGSFSLTTAVRSSFAAVASKTSFLPFRLPLRAVPLTGGLVVTAALRAAVMSLTYWIWPSRAPDSMGPGESQY